MNLYFDASRALDSLDSKKGSVKSVLASFPEANRKRAGALIIETLKYKPVLATIIEKSSLLQAERKHLGKTSNLALVLVHDLLFAKPSGIQAGDGPVKQAILRHKARLQAELTRVKIAKGVSDLQSLAVKEDERSENIPRYGRVNRCMWDMESAKKHFIAQGYTLVSQSDSVPAEGTFSVDAHIPHLLEFHPSAKLHKDTAYHSGKLILQEKASCMPPVVLAPPTTENSVVIDATAAPGNKTSYLSALMQNRGKLYAFERNKTRYATLCDMLAKAGCKNVTTLHADFLAANPEDSRFSKVTHILLDPSCSGSGIVNRLDHLLENGDEDSPDQDDRLQKLADFQLSIIQHAMKFSSVQHITYSTCSVHATENEDVVSQALRCEIASDPENGFVLADRHFVLPTWSRRGLKDSSLGAQGGEIQAEKVIRCNAGEDKTNGFFVALFSRKSLSTTSTPAIAGQGTGEKRRAQPDVSEESQKSRPTKRKKRKTKHKDS